jgi:hypothetical protein
VSGECGERRGQKLVGTSNLRRGRKTKKNEESSKVRRLRANKLKCSVNLLNVVGMNIGRSGGEAASN